jgi:hypothetical protein
MSDKLVIYARRLKQDGFSVTRAAYSTNPDLWDPRSPEDCDGYRKAALLGLAGVFYGSSKELLSNGKVSHAVATMMVTGSTAATVEVE